MEPATFGIDAFTEGAARPGLMRLTALCFAVTAFLKNGMFGVTLHRANWKSSGKDSPFQTPSKAFMIHGKRSKCQLFSPFRIFFILMTVYYLCPPNKHKMVEVTLKSYEAYEWCWLSTCHLVLLSFTYVLTENLKPFFKTSLLTVLQTSSSFPFAKCQY